MLIGELARRAGVSRDTIRYYERQGVISVRARRGNNYKEYPEQAAGLLKFIGELQGMGLTLRDIKEFIRLFKGNAHTCKNLATGLHARLQVIEEKLSRLEHMKTQLQRVMKLCCQRPDDKLCLAFDEIVGKALN